MLSKVEKQKKELELAKIELKKQKKQLIETTEESENKAVSLENMIVIKNSYISQLSEEEKEYADNIVEMQNEIKKVEAEILQAATLNIGYDYVGGEMAWPVPGHTIITSKFHLHPTRFPHGPHLVVVEKTYGFFIAHCLQFPSDHLCQVRHGE